MAELCGCWSGGNKAAACATEFVRPRPLLFAFFSSLVFPLLLVFFIVSIWAIRLLTSCVVCVFALMTSASSCASLRSAASFSASAAASSSSWLAAPTPMSRVTVEVTFMLAVPRKRPFLPFARSGTCSTSPCSGLASLLFAFCLLDLRGETSWVMKLEPAANGSLDRVFRFAFFTFSERRSLDFPDPSLFTATGSSCSSPDRQSSWPEISPTSACPSEASPAESASAVALPDLLAFLFLFLSFLEALFERVPLAGSPSDSEASAATSPSSGSGSLLTSTAVGGATSLSSSLPSSLTS
mmetsp:Transcript_5398/g.20546  ORF Transcript_5398/g.20546 Transcript_5398/m.20546 type:complete len:297 (-) Transcript_5398:553-1443(-)